MVDKYGASDSYWVVVSAGFIGAVVAFAAARRKRTQATIDVELPSLSRG
jgi:hypothetical protein